jgi:hypothetical protein
MGVAMPEAFTEKWQEFSTTTASGQLQKEFKILVAVCNLMQMNLVASKPLLEGRVSEVEIP